MRLLERLSVAEFSIISHQYIINIIRRISDDPIITFIMVLVWYIGSIFAVVKLTQKSLKWYQSRNIKKRYRKGMETFNKYQNKVVELLYGYYSNGEIKKQGVYSISYEYENSIRHLALITMPELLLKENSSLQIKSYYKGENSFTVNAKQLKKAKKQWKSLGLEIYNGKIYTLHNFSFHNSNHSGELHLTFKHIEFHLYRATLGYLFDELILKIANKDMKALNNHIHLRLPDRDRYLQSVDMIFDLPGRICAGGIIAMVAAKTDVPKNELVVFVQRRSPIVSDGPGLLTLLPRAFHEAIQYPKREYKLENTLYREFEEELFNVPTENRFLNPNRHQWLQGINISDYILQPIGLFWDLYKGNYVVGYCLYIENVNWWEQNRNELVANWETDDRMCEPLLINDDTRLIKSLILSEDWTHDSYFVFIEGLRWLSRKEDKLKDIDKLLPKLKLEYFSHNN